MDLIHVLRAELEARRYHNKDACALYAAERKRTLRSIYQELRHHDQEPRDRNAKR